MAELVPLTRAHWVAFHGEQPAYRVRGVAVVDGDRVLCIGGIGYHKGILEVFMDMVPEAAQFPKLLLKGGKQVIEMGRQVGLPMFATRDESLESSERFLRRLGFEEIEGVWHVRS